MMDAKIDDRDSRIRARAYALWEAEGRPEGRHHDHWAEAEAGMDPEAQAQMVAGMEEAAPPAAGRAAPPRREAQAQIEAQAGAEEARVRSDQGAG